jgi:hypothetical protein
VQASTVLPINDALSVSVMTGAMVATLSFMFVTDAHPLPVFRRIF